jgi:hypothetical protein
MTGLAEDVSRAEMQPNERCARRSPAGQLLVCLEVSTKSNFVAVIFDLLPLLLSAAAIVFVRCRLGFQFPVPWPDETGFVAPAFDMAHTGSFFDPGMNPDRVVMWMPPGYMLLLAAVFRLFGYGFSLARWVSTACALASLALTGGLAWRLTRGAKRVFVLWATAIVFISPVVLIDSNIARMEMLFCVVVLLSLTAAVSGRLYLAAALIGLAALIHFNAVYFAGSILACFALQIWHRSLRPPSGYEWLALCGAMLAIFAYGIYVAQNWTGFVADMNFQFHLKALFGHDDPDHPAWPVWAGALIAIPFAARARGLGASAPVLFGLAFLLSVHEGHELWYDDGLPLGFLLILLGLASLPWQRIGAICALALAGLVVLASTRVTPKMQPLLPSWDMLHRDVVPAGQIAKVRAFIATLHPGETVDFGWSGMEPFFLDDLYRAGAKWTILRHSVTQVPPFRTPDWRVRCDSSEWPAYVMHFDIGFARAGKDTGCDIMRTKAS